MRVLDIDLDLFLWIYNDFPRDRDDHDDNVVFDEEEVRNFLEKNCGLSTSNPIEGIVVQTHDEAFDYWNNLIQENRLTTPFELVHADMHSDMYNKSYNYIFGDLMHHDISKRKSNIDRTKIDCTNYLLFAIACGWLEKLTYVTHHGLEDGYDLQPFHFKNWDIHSGFIELKAYDKDFLKNYIDFTDAMPPSIKSDKPVPFNRIYMGEYFNNQTFDFVVLCISEDYTPYESDSLIPIIKEYIKIK